MGGGRSEGARARPYRAVRFGATIGPNEVGALKHLFSEPAGDGAGEGTEDEGEDEGAGG